MIVLQDVAWTDLHALVEFIYHGEVNVHQRSLSSFLKTAEVLRVSGLTQQHGDGREQVKHTKFSAKFSAKKLYFFSWHKYKVWSDLNNNNSRTQRLQHRQSPTITVTTRTNSSRTLCSPHPPPHLMVPPSTNYWGGRPSNIGENDLKGLCFPSVSALILKNWYFRRISSDPEISEHKRARAEHIIGNNNNNELNLSHNPPQTQPADFSPSAMKNNALNLNINSSLHKTEVIEGKFCVNFTTW